MLGNYTIYIRDKNGYFRDRLTDITTLQIIEKVNDVGSWSIKSKTKEKCPFRAGDGIVVYKKGRYYYSGVLTSIREDYSGYDLLYEWTASGASDLMFLQWRICYPDPITLDLDTVSHYTDSGFVGSVSQRIIDLNVGISAHGERQVPFLGATIVESEGNAVSVSLRFQTVLQAVTNLMNSYQFTVRPVWNAERKMLNFYIRESKDASSKVAFSTSVNMMEKMTYKETAPNGNSILAGGKGELESRHFAKAENAESISEWGRIEYFFDRRSVDDATMLAETNAYLRESSQENIGFIPEMIGDAATEGFKIKWELGDYVAVFAQDKVAIQRILQMDTIITYNSETVKPTVGSIENGHLNSVFESLKLIRSDLNQVQQAND